VLLLLKSSYHRYCIVQNTLTDYLERIDCTIEELYREVREAQTESTDPFLKTFIDCLLASADYESFYKVPVHSQLLWTIYRTVNNDNIFLALK
jgi:hypothetical protein